jgi:hypothetical protein
MEFAPKESGETGYEKQLRELSEELEDLIESSSQLLSYIHLKFAKNFKSERAECVFLREQPQCL